MRPDIVGSGGFDSHALPPRHAPRAGRLAVWCAAALLLIVGGARAAHAQRTDAARAGVAAPDSITPPPVGPMRAFLYSLAIPGLGQAKLDRPLVGAGFFLMEAFSIALVHRTSDDLRLARAFRRDSLPLTFATDPTTGAALVDGKGNPVVATWSKAYYNDDLVRARRLQLEDWTAILLFNHLIAGAEAFVAAELWDLPQHVKLRAAPIRGGVAITGSLRP